MLLSIYSYIYMHMYILYQFIRQLFEDGGKENALLCKQLVLLRKDVLLPGLTDIAQLNVRTDTGGGVGVGGVVGEEGGVGEGGGVGAGAGEGVVGGVAEAEAEAEVVNVYI
jgi:hypothetical protein